MRVVFRVDSSEKIGTGHLMRCLTLAGRLARGFRAEIFFVCRDLAGNLSPLVTQAGYGLILLPRAEGNPALTGYAAWLTVSEERDAAETIAALERLAAEDAAIAQKLAREAAVAAQMQDAAELARAEALAKKAVMSSRRLADLLVVDSYAISAVWESKLRPYVGKILAIDDLANRPHDCDALLDQNFYFDAAYGAARYDGLVPDYCLRLVGTKYALLRDEFFRAREMLEKTGRLVRKILRRILVFYGGSDLTDETSKALRALVRLYNEGVLRDVTLDVVVGASNARREAVREFCEKYEWIEYSCQVSDMAARMAAADLALGAGGTTTWERCCLGLPTIVTAIADNQRGIAADCARAGLICYLGEAQNVTEDKIVDAVLASIQLGGIEKMSKSSCLKVERDIGEISLMLKESGAARE